MERIELTDYDVERIESLVDAEAGTLIDVLVPDQRFAVEAHVSRSATTRRSPVT